MTHVRFDFQSPLALIRQWQLRADGASLLEVLITGYTLDLAFFEKRCVSLARGLGARITVLADAHQSVHDPADVRLAGTSYQHANVGCQGAFHPKLAVLVGEEDVWVAIGSGNPTTSGWGHNDELWLVLKSSRTTGPAALLELADWLRRLHSHVKMPTWIASTVIEIADMVIPEVTDDSVPALRILGNLKKPIIDQLPAVEVNSLALSAPFFDYASAAVRELVGRFKPKSLIVGIQPRLGSYDGVSLVAATAHVPSAAFRDLPDSDGRVSHGKLVEWTVDGKSTALIGSPNLSYAALLSSTEEGGNCELAVVFPVDQTLLPEGTDVAVETIRQRSTLSAAAEPRLSPPVTLLGARRELQGITVELIVESSVPIVIETSPNGGPGTWQQCHVIRPDGASLSGVVAERFQAPEQMGAAVRAVVDDPKTPYTTPAVFLTDTARCLPRQVNSSAPRLKHQFGDFFSDEKLQRRFEADLLRLLAENASQRSQSAASRPTRQQPARASSTDRWTLWLQGTEATIGPTFTASLFPFSAAARTPTPAQLQQWDVDLAGASEDIAEGEDPESVDPIADDEEESGERLPPVVPPAMRHKMRHFAIKLSARSRATPQPSLELRMLVLRLILDLLAAGVWGPDDDGWRAPVADAIIALPPTADEEVPDRALDFLGSLAAVGLALLAQGASLHGGREQDLIFRKAWEAASLHAAMAEIGLSEQYLYQPAEGYSRVAGLAGVESVIELAQDYVNDSNAAVRTAVEDAAAEKGWDVKFGDGLWIVSAAQATPRAVAAKIATVIGEHEKTCGVFVETKRGKCVLLRHNSILAVAENNCWRVGKLRSSLSTPASRLSEGSLGGEAYSLANPPQSVTELCGQIGVESEQVRLFLKPARTVLESGSGHTTPESTF
ncbi:hypothetical protein [Mycobacterium sp. DBP42]|uniref:hypothetical protein n=1 Tax=Mycobacterium sp. DBP42 TaxID=2545267 RepID=UPI00110CAB2D|nr:hypothetical protein [Mycobacterium sp. DBP42]TMS54784.1 hypothetical protein E0T84_04275 [Mycobacterium sp. DBP42]